MRNKSVSLGLASQCVVVGVDFFVCLVFLPTTRKDILKRFGSLSTQAKPLEQQCVRESALLLNIISGVTRHSSTFSNLSNTFSVATSRHGGSDEKFANSQLTKSLYEKKNPKPQRFHVCFSTRPPAVLLVVAIAMTIIADSLSLIGSGLHSGTSGLEIQGPSLPQCTSN